MTFIKRKHLWVVLFSSIIVATVFVLTLVGYGIYIQWKKDSFALRYRNSIYKLTAELFKNEVIVSNVNVYSGDIERFSGMPLLEGNIKNNSVKGINSILLEVSFVSEDGTVVYNDWVHPLGDRFFGTPTLFAGTQQTKNVLLPGDSISFRHLLRNCPRELVEQVSTKEKFARGSSKDKIKLVYLVKGLNVI